MRVLRWAVAVVVAAEMVAYGCGGGGSSPAPGGGGPPALPVGLPAPGGSTTGSPGFTFSADSSRLALPQGGDGTLGVAIVASSALTSAVSVAVVGLPAGVGVDPLSLDASHPSGSLHFHTAPTAAAPSPVGSWIRATSEGGQVTLPLSVTVRGTPGSLDRSFANDGEAVDDDAGGGNDVFAESIVIAGSGNLYVGGEAGIPGMMVWALAPSGARLASFGANGVDFLDTPGLRAASVKQISLTVDGLPVVAGTAFNGTSGMEIVVARLDADGALDPKFGAGGVVQSDLTGDDDGLTIAPLAGGAVAVGGRSHDDSVVLRYRADGSLDPTFGSGGVTRPILGDGRRVLRMLALDDGRLLLAIGGGHDAIVRLRTDGSLDPTFGGTGILSLGSSMEPYGLCFDPVGVRVASIASNSMTVVQRVLHDGTLDPTFGAVAIPGALGGVCRSTKDGQSFIAATTPMDAAGVFRPALIHLTAAGTLDPAFGRSGVAVLDSASGYGSSVALDPQGRPVLVGSVHTANGVDFEGAAWRFWN